MNIFTIPGLYNSGPQHWHTHWENKYGFSRIQQLEWEKPVCEAWLSTIEDYLHSFSDDEIVLIGHSLGCNAIVRWAQKYQHKIAGALLVGPSDVDAPIYPEGTNGFKPMPLNKLDFPSMVIASSNDEYVSIERASQFASNWGSTFIDIGPLGHINSASNLGEWPEGYAYLQQLIKADR